MSKPLWQILPLKICSIVPSPNANNVICELSLMRIGNKETKKEKRAKLYIILICSKNIILKAMKATSYKMK